MENLCNESEIIPDEVSSESAEIAANAEDLANDLAETSNDVAIDVCSELGEFHPGITEESAGAICNLERYRELRALGLDTKEAYRATSIERSASTRRHLSGAIGNAAAPNRKGISEQELRSARELFGGISDAEIRQLYNRVNV